MCSLGTSANSLDEASNDSLERPSNSLKNKREQRVREINNNKFLIAISEKNLDEVKSLMDKVDINFKDQDGCTPLHWAVETGDIQMIELLLHHGVDFFSKNNLLETPLDIAKKMNLPNIVNLLEKSVSAVDKVKIENTKGLETDGQLSSLEDQENVWINPVHGYIYQLKILMLFLHRGLAFKYSFRLGTEIKEAKKFDDLVFEYVEGTKKVYRLLQAKHKFDENKKITVDKLLIETKGDYSLIKYFHSFQACKNDNFFKDGIIKDVIICTNIDFDYNDLKRNKIELKKVQEKDDILDMKSKQKEPSRYKFTNSLVGKLKPKLKKGVSDNEIKDFLNHLIFAVNQPNEEELGQIVKEEISREMGLLDTEKAYNKLLSKMMDLSLGKENSMFLTYKDGKKFFDDLKENMPVWFNIQSPVSSFTGRVEDLRRIHEFLKGKFNVCVSGMGGIGKTELIRKYVTDFGYEYDNQVVWINAESYRTAVDSFRQLASDKLNISLINSDGKEKHITSIVTDVYQFFSKNKSLFIFDNAEKYKCEYEFDCGIEQFLPCLPDNKVKPKIIITSQNQKWPESIKTIVLKPLTVNEARELVQKTLCLENDKENELIVELVEKLQLLPLALQQAVAYIKTQKEKLACIEANFGISNYLERYTQTTHELLDYKFPEESDSTYNKSVFATWNINLNALKEKENGQDALEILNIISYCLPENIPVEFLLSFPSNKERLSAAIGLLKQYSIVSVQHKSVSIHRLVQQVTRLRLQIENDEVEILKIAMSLLSRNNINIKNIDHVISIWKYASKFSELLDDYSSLSTFLIKELSDCGRIQEAVSIGIEVSKSLQDSAQNDIAALTCSLVIKNNIAMAHLKNGQYKEALEQFKKIHKLQLAIMKPTDSQVLSTKNNMCTTLIELGRIKDALKCCYELIDEYKVNPEINHSNIFLSKSRLACLLSGEGKHAEALSIMQEIDYEQKRNLDDRHPKTLALKSNIAKFLFRMKRFDESLKILKEVCSDEEATLPKNHHNILETKYNIADVLTAQEKHSEAMKIFQELYDVQKEKFGENHPDILDINVHIAIVLKRQNECEKAIKILRPAFNQLRKLLGPAHSKTILAQYGLADALYRQNQYSEALVLYKDLVDKQASVSYRPSDMLHFHKAILSIYIEQKNYNDALECSLEVLKISESMCEKNHPSLFIDRNNVGMMYYYTGNCNTALDILTQLLKAQETFLGKNHIDCQRTKYNIATVKAGGSKHAKVRTSNIHNVKAAQLLEKDAALNAKDADGFTMLHHALNDGNEQQVERILEQGAEVFVSSNKGNTPLHLAVLKGQEKCVELLLKKVKPDRLNDFVDAKTISGASTALHVAAKMGHFNIVKYLLKNRATFCVKNKDDKTPLDLSTDSTVVDLLKMVHELFENVSKPDATDVIKKLKTLSSDEIMAATNTRNDRGSTLSQVAILNKQKHVAAEILKMVQGLKRK